MNDSLRAKLKLQCPVLCRGRDLPLLNCGEGWYQHIEKMMRELEVFAQQYRNQGRDEEELPKLVWIETHHATMQAVIDNLTAEMDEIVEQYEEGSESVCEHCGKPGRPQGKWTEILCDDCYGEI